MSPAEQSALESAQRCAARCVELNAENQRLSDELEKAKGERDVAIFHKEQSARVAGQVIGENQTLREGLKGLVAAVTPFAARLYERGSAFDELRNAFLEALTAAQSLLNGDATIVAQD